ncbi:MAG: hypothetical protein R3C49_02335 [Planctomycetaceae bacterium]
MKFSLLMLTTFSLGLAVFFSQRPNVEDLTYEASIAWNSGDLDRAEQLSRRLLARAPDSVRGREILRNRSMATNRPELALAVAEMDFPNNSPAPDRYIRLSGIAMSRGLFRIADEYLADGLHHFPDHQRLQQQFVALSGLRLDPEEMLRRLLAWAKSGRPAPEFVIMYLGLSSLDSRAASSSEEWLRQAVEADASDIDSRLGLARCLMLMGKLEQCCKLLDASTFSERAAVLHAVAFALRGEIAAAKDCIPTSVPTRFQAEYRYALGLIAIHEERWEEAARELGSAVELKPLSTSYRARYCESLRRLKRDDEHLREVKKLETLIQLVKRSHQLQRHPDMSQLSELRQLCEQLGDSPAVTIISAIENY